MNYQKVELIIGCNIPEAFFALQDWELSMSIEDKRALTVMESSANFVDGHRQLALIVQEQMPNLPTNRIMAEQRLKLLKKRFLQDAELFEKYNVHVTIGYYINKGHSFREQACSPKNHCGIYPITLFLLFFTSR